MRYSVAVLMLVLMTSACAKKGFTEVQLEQGHLELLVPEEFTMKKDTSFMIDPVTAHEIRTFKFTSAKDSMSAVGVAYSLNANSDLTLDVFLNNMEQEARRSPKVKVLNKETKTINDRQVGTLSYVMVSDTGETDFSNIAFTILDKNIYTCNVYFQGKVQPDYQAKANTIVESFKIRK